MKCWCTMPMPARMASCGLRSFTSSPLIAMVPSSGGCMPYRIFIRVDLPAPFSPQMACTSPAVTVRLTSELATTPGKRLVIPVSWTAGAPRSGTASAGASAVLMGGRIPYL
jgi:hypothetical protein